jgi:cell fate (sporulation/competence/biofilm development) regulator YlbF (YheA/YmcA/DUF963 family)
MMQLNDEIKTAAEDLGKRLGTEAGVMEYVNLKMQAQQNLEVAGLEAKYSRLYEKLAKQQRNGEKLECSELDEYYAIKYQVEGHPLIAARDLQLQEVNALFNQTAQHMTAILGIDYATLAG